MPKAWSVSQGKDGDSENEVSVVLCLQQIITYGVLISLSKSCGFLVEMFKAASTHCNEIGSHCSEIGSRHSE